jgi:outer membrane protein OmpA-like peptidoglycan-associated protein
MTRKGKCTNYAGCLRAYRSEEMNVAAEDFRCPECHQPLVPSEEVRRPNKLLPAFIIAGTLLMLGIIALFAFRSLRGPAPVETTAAASARPAPPSPAPAAASSSPAPTPAAPEMEGQSAAPASINLDVQNEENRRIKGEVLKRIDLMPNISSENKDKLYVSVERARQMGKVVTIPFPSGKTSLSATGVESLRNVIQSPELQKLMQDPTVVFVILGFADTKGDEKKNLQFSQTRAQNVLDTLRDKCGVINVMHAVGMGGSDLFDQQNVDKNRLVEVWAVLP